MAGVEKTRRARVGLRRLACVLAALQAFAGGPVHPGEEQASDAGAGAPSAAALPEAQPEEQVAELRRRGLVLLPGSQDGFVEALVVFGRPVDEVVALLTQAERQAEYRSEFGELSIVEVSANGWLEEQRTRILFVRLSYRLRWRYDLAERTMAWELDPSFDNSVEHVSGFWEFHELDAGRTLGRFGTRVRVGPVLPRFLQEPATRRNVRKSLESMRRWVDSDGTWRP